VTTVLDLDPATLSLVDGAQWAGDATWTVFAPPAYGPVTGRHYNDLPTLRLAFGTGAPAQMFPALAAVGAQWTVHLVARTVVTADGEGVSLAGTPLRMTAAGGWMLGYGSTVTDPVIGVRVLTVACDGTTATLYLDGVVVGMEPAWALGEGSVAVLAAGGPGHVWELARLQLLDEVPSTLADDIAALVTAYVSDVVELEASGTWRCAWVTCTSRRPCRTPSRAAGRTLPRCLTRCRRRTHSTRPWCAGTRRSWTPRT
jgi:hypothetical protein